MHIITQAVSGATHNSRGHIGHSQVAPISGRDSNLKSLTRKATPPKKAQGEGSNQGGGAALKKGATANLSKELQHEEDEELSKSSKAMFRWASSLTISYFAFGVCVYSRYGRMTALEALYFVVVTLTTVGYGDHCNITSCGQCTTEEEELGECESDSVWSSDNMVWFTAFFVLFGIMLMGSALGIIAAELVAAHDAAMAAAKHSAIEKQATEQLQRSKTSARSTIKGVVAAGGALSRRAQLHLPEGVWKLLPSIIQAAIVLGLGMLLIWLDSGKSLSMGRCFYFAVVTSTTVGYGDISPVTNAGRGFACLYLLVGVVAIGNVLSHIAGYFVDAKQRETLERILSKKITKEDFEKFDVDGDGRIEKTEFVVRKLMLMGLLNAEDVERVETEFEVMDADGSGEITMEDLDMYLHDH